MSWVVDPEVLIIEVEARPFLYAKTLPEYSNKIIKNNAWEDINKKLSEDRETLNNDVGMSGGSYLSLVTILSIDNLVLPWNRTLWRCEIFSKIITYVYTRVVTS